MHLVNPLLLAIAKNHLSDAELQGLVAHLVGSVDDSRAFHHVENETAARVLDAVFESVRHRIGPDGVRLVETTFVSLCRLALSAPVHSTGRNISRCPTYATVVRKTAADVSGLAAELLMLIEQSLGGAAAAADVAAQAWLFNLAEGLIADALGGKSLADGAASPSLAASVENREQKERIRHIAMFVTDFQVSEVIPAVGSPLPFGGAGGGASLPVQLPGHMMRKICVHAVVALRSLDGLLASDERHDAGRVQVVHACLRLLSVLALSDAIDVEAVLDEVANDANTLMIPSLLLSAQRICVQGCAQVPEVGAPLDATTCASLEAFIDACTSLLGRAQLSVRQMSIVSDLFARLSAAFWPRLSQGLMDKTCSLAAQLLLLWQAHLEGAMSTSIRANAAAGNAAPSGGLHNLFEVALRLNVLQFSQRCALLAAIRGTDADMLAVRLTILREMVWEPPFPLKVVQTRADCGVTCSALVTDVVLRTLPVMEPSFNPSLCFAHVPLSSLLGLAEVMDPKGLREPAKSDIREALSKVFTRGTTERSLDAAFLSLGRFEHVDAARANARWDDVALFLSEAREALAGPTAPAVTSAIFDLLNSMLDALTASLTQMSAVAPVWQPIRGEIVMYQLLRLLPSIKMATGSLRRKLWGVVDAISSALVESGHHVQQHEADFADAVVRSVLEDLFSSTPTQYAVPLATLAPLLKLEMALREPPLATALARAALDFVPQFHGRVELSQQLFGLLLSLAPRDAVARLCAKVLTFINEDRFPRGGATDIESSIALAKTAFSSVSEALMLGAREKESSGSPGREATIGKPDDATATSKKKKKKSKAKEGEKKKKKKSKKKSSSGSATSSADGKSKRTGKSKTRHDDVGLAQNEDGDPVASSDRDLEAALESGSSRNRASGSRPRRTRWMNIPASLGQRLEDLRVAGSRPGDSGGIAGLNLHQGSLTSGMDRFLSLPRDASRIDGLPDFRSLVWVPDDFDGGNGADLFMDSDGVMDDGEEDGKRNENDKTNDEEVKDGDDDDDDDDDDEDDDDDDDDDDDEDNEGNATLQELGKMSGSTDAKAKTRVRGRGDAASGTGGDENHDAKDLDGDGADLAVDNDMEELVSLDMDDGDNDDGDNDDGDNDDGINDDGDNNDEEDDEEDEGDQDEDGDEDDDNEEEEDIVEEVVVGLSDGDDAVEDNDTGGGAEGMEIDNDDEEKGAATGRTGDPQSKAGGGADALQVSDDGADKTAQGGDRDKGHYVADDRELASAENLLHYSRSGDYRAAPQPSVPASSPRALLARDAYTRETPSDRIASVLAGIRWRQEAARANLDAQRATSSLAAAAAGTTPAAPLRRKKAPASRQTCTYSTTGETYQMQHWYHCLTCDLVEGKGCCAICARTCHRGHEITYARRSRFFCDCGAGSKCNAQKPRIVSSDPGFKRGDGGSLLGSRPSLSGSGAAVNSATSVPRAAVTLRDIVEACFKELEAGAGLVLTDEVAALVKESGLDRAIYKSLLWLQRTQTELDASGSTLRGFFELRVSTVADAFKVRRKFSDLPAGLAAFSAAHRLPISRGSNILALAGRAGMPAGLGGAGRPQAHDRLVAANSRGQVFVAEGVALRCIHAAPLLCPDARDSSGKLYGARKTTNTGAAADAQARASQGEVNKVSEAALSPVRVSLNFVVRQIEFNPWKSDVVAVRGESSCQVLKLSENGSVENKIRLELALGLTPLEMQTGILGKLIGVAWAPGYADFLIVVSTLWMKVFDYATDCTYPVLFFDFGDQIETFAVVPGAGNTRSARVYLATQSGRVKMQNVNLPEKKQTTPPPTIDPIDIDQCWKRQNVVSMHVPPSSLAVSGGHALLVSLADGSIGRITIGPDGSVIAQEHPLQVSDTASPSSSSSAPSKTGEAASSQPVLQWLDWFDTGSVYSPSLGTGAWMSIGLNKRASGQSRAGAMTVVTEGTSSSAPSRGLAIYEVSDLISPSTWRDDDSQTLGESTNKSASGARRGGTTPPSDQAHSSREAARSRGAGRDGGSGNTSGGGRPDSGRPRTVVDMCVWPPVWSPGASYDNFRFEQAASFFSSVPSVWNLSRAFGGRQPEDRLAQDVTFPFMASINPVLLVLYSDGSLARCAPRAPQRDLENKLKILLDGSHRLHGIQERELRGAGSRPRSAKARRQAKGATATLGGASEKTKAPSSSSSSIIPAAAVRGGGGLDDAKLCAKLEVAMSEAAQIPTPFIFEKLTLIASEHALAASFAWGGSLLKAMGGSQRLGATIHKRSTATVQRGVPSEGALVLTAQLASPSHALVALRICIAAGGSEARNDVTDLGSRRKSALASAVAQRRQRRKAEAQAAAERGSKEREDTGPNYLYVGPFQRRVCVSKRSTSAWYDLPLTPLEAIIAQATGTVDLVFDAGTVDHVITSGEAYAMPTHSQLWLDYMRPAWELTRHILGNFSSGRLGAQTALASAWDCGLDAAMFLPGAMDNNCEALVAVLQEKNARDLFSGSLGLSVSHFAQIALVEKMRQLRREQALGQSPPVGTLMSSIASEALVMACLERLGSEIPLAQQSLESAMRICHTIDLARRRYTPMFRTWLTARDRFREVFSPLAMAIRDRGVALIKLSVDLRDDSALDLQRAVYTFVQGLYHATAVLFWHRDASTGASEHSGASVESTERDLHKASRVIIDLTAAGHAAIAHFVVHALKSAQAVFIHVSEKEAKAKASRTSADKQQQQEQGQKQAKNKNKKTDGKFEAEEEEEHKEQAKQEQMAASQQDFIVYRCDGCEKVLYSGSRFECSVCEDFDLCSTCHRNGVEGHDPSHRMVERGISVEQSEPAGDASATRAKRSADGAVSASTKDGGASDLLLADVDAVLLEAHTSNGASRSTLTYSRMKVFASQFCRALLETTLSASVSAPPATSDANRVLPLVVLSKLLSDIVQRDLDSDVCRSEVKETKSEAKHDEAGTAGVDQAAVANESQHSVAELFVDRLGNEAAALFASIETRADLATALQQDGASNLFGVCLACVVFFSTATRAKLSEASKEVQANIANSALRILALCSELDVAETDAVFGPSTVRKSQVVQARPESSPNSASSSSYRENARERGDGAQDRAQPTSAEAALWNPCLGLASMKLPEGGAQRLFADHTLARAVLKAVATMAAICLVEEAEVDEALVLQGVIPLVSQARFSFLHRQCNQVLRVLCATNASFDWERNKAIFHTDLRAVQDVLAVIRPSDPQPGQELRGGLMPGFIPGGATYDDMAQSTLAIEKLHKSATRAVGPWQRFCADSNCFGALFSALGWVTASSGVLILEALVCGVPAAASMDETSLSTGAASATKTEEKEGGKARSAARRMLTGVLTATPEILHKLVDYLMLEHTSQNVRLLAAVLWRRIYVALSGAATPQDDAQEELARTVRRAMVVHLACRFETLLDSGSLFGLELLDMVRVMAARSEWKEIDFDPATRRAMAHKVEWLMSSLTPLVLGDEAHIRNVQLGNMVEVGSTLLSNETDRELSTRHESCPSCAESKGKCETSNGAESKARSRKAAKHKPQRPFRSADTLREVALAPVAPSAISLFSCGTCRAPRREFKSLTLQSSRRELSFTSNSMLVRMDCMYSVSAIHVSVQTHSSVFGCGVDKVSVYCNSDPSVNLNVLQAQDSQWHEIASFPMGKETAFRLVARLAVPVSTCNLLFRYHTTSELAFSQNSERQTCPRCNRVVNNKNGVCTCGEVVFQCRQCRRINQEDRNAFLCVDCGYCRYAKFTYTLEARVSTDYPPIHSEADREQANRSILSFEETAQKLRDNILEHTGAPEEDAVKIWELAARHLPGSIIQPLSGEADVGVEASSSTKARSLRGTSSRDALSVDEADLPDTYDAGLKGSRWIISGIEGLDDAALDVRSSKMDLLRSLGILRDPRGAQAHGRPAPPRRRARAGPDGSRKASDTAKDASKALETKRLVNGDTLSSYLHSDNTLQLLEAALQTPSAFASKPGERSLRAGRSRSKAAAHSRGGGASASAREGVRDIKRPAAAARSVVENLSVEPNGVEVRLHDHLTRATAAYSQSPHALYQKLLTTRLALGAIRRQLALYTHRSALAMVLSPPSGAGAGDEQAPPTSAIERFQLEADQRLASCVERQPLALVNTCHSCATEFIDAVFRLLATLKVTPWFLGEMSKEMRSRLLSHCLDFGVASDIDSGEVADEVYARSGEGSDDDPERGSAAEGVADATRDHDGGPVGAKSSRMKQEGAVVIEEIVEGAESNTSALDGDGHGHNEDAIDGAKGNQHGEGDRGDENDDEDEEDVHMDVDGDENDDERKDDIQLERLASKAGRTKEKKKKEKKTKGSDGGEGGKEEGQTRGKADVEDVGNEDKGGECKACQSADARRKELVRVCGRGSFHAILGIASVDKQALREARDAVRARLLAVVLHPETLNNGNWAIGLTQVLRVMCSSSTSDGPAYLVDTLGNIVKMDPAGWHRATFGRAVLTQFLRAINENLSGRALASAELGLVRSLGVEIPLASDMALAARRVGRFVRAHWRELARFAKRSDAEAHRRVLADPDTWRWVWVVVAGCSQLCVRNALEALICDLVASLGPVDLASFHAGFMRQIHKTWQEKRDTTGPQQIRHFFGMLRLTIQGQPSLVFSCAASRGLVEDLCAVIRGESWNVARYEQTMLRDRMMVPGEAATLDVSMAWASSAADLLQMVVANSAPARRVVAGKHLATVMESEILLNSLRSISGVESVQSTRNKLQQIMAAITDERKFDAQLFGSASRILATSAAKVREVSCDVDEAHALVQSLIRLVSELAAIIEPVKQLPNVYIVMNRLRSQEDYFTSNLDSSPISIEDVPVAGASGDDEEAEGGGQGGSGTAEGRASQQQGDGGDRVDGAATMEAFLAEFLDAGAQGAGAVGNGNSGSGGAGASLGPSGGANKRKAEPTMRDLRTKIAQDLNFANAQDIIEFLVAGKIVNIDLPVRLVYEKVWLPHVREADGTEEIQENNWDSDVSDDEDHPMEEDDDDEEDTEVIRPMEVTYRLMGIDGEATEDFVENLQDETEENEDPETRYAQTKLLQPQGLEAILSILDASCSRFSLRSKIARECVSGLVHMLGLACNCASNRAALASASSGGIRILLRVLRASFQESAAGDLAEQVVVILERLVVERMGDSRPGAATGPEQDAVDAAAEADPGVASAASVAATASGQSQLQVSLEHLDDPNRTTTLRNRRALCRLLPFLTFGRREEMRVLLERFKRLTDLERVDESPRDAIAMQADLKTVYWSIMATGRDKNAVLLRDMALEMGFTGYLVGHVAKWWAREAPPEEKRSAKTGSAKKRAKKSMREAYARLARTPSVILAMGLLTGLALGHVRTQALIREHGLLELAFEMETIPAKDVPLVGEYADAFMGAASLDNEVQQAYLDDLRTARREAKRLRASAKQKNVLKKMGLSPPNMSGAGSGGQGGQRKRKRSESEDGADGGGAESPVGGAAGTPAAAERGAGEAQAAASEASGGATAGVKKSKKKSKKAKNKKAKLGEGAGTSLGASSSAKMPTWMKEMESLENEEHPCVICKEGYANKPMEPMGVYIFSKAIDVEPFMSYVDVEGAVAGACLGDLSGLVPSAAVARVRELAGGIEMHLPLAMRMVVEMASLDDVEKSGDEGATGSKRAGAKDAEGGDEGEHSGSNNNSKDSKDAKKSGSGLRTPPWAEASRPKSAALASSSSRRRILGTSSVTSFNAVHLSCHAEAVRVDMSNDKAKRSEWEGAELRNTNVKTNNLLPLRGPATISSDRYNGLVEQYFEKLQRRIVPSLSSSHGPCAMSIVLLDLRALLLRLCWDEPLSLDTHGGGHDSNFKLVVPLLSMAAHLLAIGSEAQRISLQYIVDRFCAVHLLEAVCDGGVCKPGSDESSKAGEKKVEIPDFVMAAVASLFVLSGEQWRAARPAFLQGVLTYAREVGASRLPAGSGVPAQQRRASISSSSACSTAGDDPERDAAATMAALRLLSVVDRLRELRRGNEGILQTIMRDEHAAISIVSDICEVFEGALLPAQSAKDALVAAGFPTADLDLWQSLSARR